MGSGEELHSSGGGLCSECFWFIECILLNLTIYLFLIIARFHFISGNHLSLHYWCLYACLYKSRFHPKTHTDSALPLKRISSSGCRHGSSADGYTHSVKLQIFLDIQELKSEWLSLLQPMRVTLWTRFSPCRLTLASRSLKGILTVSLLLLQTSCEAFTAPSGAGV